MVKPHRKQTQTIVRARKPELKALISTKKVMSSKKINPESRSAPFKGQEGESVVRHQLPTLKDTLLPIGKVMSSKKINPESRSAPFKGQEGESIVRHQLPTLKDILLPIGMAMPATNSEDEIRLDSQDPKYISYLSTIKNAIELSWQYPDPARRNGAQGKLLLRFTVLGNGSLKNSHLIQSSGFSILDEEAFRAVRAASPFNPIPSWIGKKQLNIVASFEYLDNQLTYSFTK